jgi:hypothetical protein
MGATAGCPAVQRTGKSSLLDEPVAAHQFAVWKQEAVSNMFLGAGQAGNFMTGSRSDKSPHHAFSNVDHSSNCYCLLTMRHPVPSAPNRKRSGHPANPTVLNVRHELSHMLDFRKYQKSYYERFSSFAREEMAPDRFTNNHTLDTLNDAERHWSLLHPFT